MAEIDLAANMQEIDAEAQAWNDWANDDSLPEWLSVERFEDDGRNEIGFFNFAFGASRRTDLQPPSRFYASYCLKDIALAPGVLLTHIILRDQVAETHAYDKLMRFINDYQNQVLAG